MFITSEGGLTTAGYALFIVIAIAALIAGIYLAGKITATKKLTTRQVAFCGISLALAFVTSYITLFKMPLGGSVTLFSMLFISLVGYWYGPAVGMMVGFAYGVLEFLQEPYFLSVLQVCFDYLFAFTALGFSGFFRNRKHGLVKGYIASAAGRFLFATLAGYFFWYDTSPEGFPKSLAWLYPIVYNFSYIFVEAVMTIIVISIPAVSKALSQVRRIALDEPRQNRGAAAN